MSAKREQRFSEDISRPAARLQAGCLRSQLARYPLLQQKARRNTPGQLIAFESVNLIAGLVSSSRPAELNSALAEASSLAGELPCVAPALPA
jgi:hypothetical protein